MTVHKSVDDAKVHYEPWFVHDRLGEAALDSRGQLLGMKVVRLRMRDALPVGPEEEDAMDVVRNVPVEDAPTHQEYLSTAIRRALRHERPEAQRLELDHLIRLALATAGKSVGFGEKIF
jgi:hypothetical protein